MTIRLGRKRLTTNVAAAASDPVWVDEVYFVSDEISQEEQDANLIADNSGPDPNLGARNRATSTIARGGSSRRYAPSGAELAY